MRAVTTAARAGVASLLLVSREARWCVSKRLGAAILVSVLGCSGPTDSDSASVDGGQPPGSVATSGLEGGTDSSSSGSGVGLEAGAPSVQPVRIAAGETTSYTDPDGNTWAADELFTGGIATTAATPVPIAGTNAPTLYNGQRYGAADGGTQGSPFSYAVPLPAGSYTVTLKFAETYLTGPGERLFDVAINGSTVLSSFDIYASAGGMNTAVDAQFPVVLAADGSIRIDFLPGAVQNPKVDAIQIVPSGNADPCAGQSCSAHGTCVAFDGAAACSCDSGYFASGSTCVAGTANVTVNLGKPTGKTVSPYLWGFSGAGMNYGIEPVPNGQNNFDTLLNATFQASAAKIKPTLVRFNTQQTLPMLQHVFANGVSTPDWTYLDTWIDNHAGFFDDGTGRLLFGIGPLGSDASTPPATFASWATAVANHFIAKGQECFWWEAGNEDNGMSATTYLGYFDAIADALHAVNPNYKVGGPVDDYWDDNGLGAAIVKNSPSKIGFINFHMYEFPVAQAPTGAQMYQSATSGRPVSDVTNTRAMMRAAGISDSVPIGLTEYNMMLDDTGGANQNATYQAALFVALYMSTTFKSDPSFTMGALWDFGGSASSGGYGAIANSAFGGDPGVIDPQGYYLGYAGSHLAGAEATYSATLSNFDVLASTSGKKWVIQLVNYDTSKDQVATIAISGGVPAATIARWEIGKANPSTPAGSQQAGLASVVVPSEEVVVLTGTFSP